MGWLDIVIIVIFIVGVLLGMKTGLIGAAVNALGVLIGWLLAGQFADDVGGLFGDSLSNDTLVTVVSYVIIIVVVLVALRIAARILRPILNIATLGLAGMVDRLGGVALGLILGFLVSGAFIIAMARFTYGLEIPEVPDLSGVSGGAIAGKLDGPLPKVVETREAVENALAESALVPLFIDIRNALPGNALGFIPSDFKVSLDALEQRIEEESSS